MRSRSDSASSSSSLPLLVTLLFILVVLGGSAGPAEAKVFLSQQEALELAFPEADRIESETFVLDEMQTRAVEKQSRAALESRIVTIFVGWRGETLLGYAHIDIHTVRTEPEAFMVVLAPEGEVRSLRVLAFYEPLDYLPTKRWYRQFEAKGADAALRLGRDVHGVVGSTLSSRAATAGVRRALALHRVLLSEQDTETASATTASVSN